MGPNRSEERITQKMKFRGIGPAEIDRFLRRVRHVREGHGAHIPLHSVSSPDSQFILETAADPAQRKELAQLGRSLLSKIVVIKLNGGRSTTMGGEVPKGIIVAKDGRTFLDIVAGQMSALRRAYGIEVPLVLMNSFFTHQPTMDLVSALPVSVKTFIQHQAPRLVEKTLEPLETGTDEDWAPAGHGDVYTSLQQSGLLEELLAEGKRYAFISNMDNLAAVLEPWILGLIERDGIEFLMEVTDRTEEDRKGGTLVLRDGALELLEIAQVNPDERDEFMDIHRFRVFNTNNIWIDLVSMARALAEDSLRLPIIQNHKVIEGTEVVQLETAMGAAIGSFATARGLRVSRDRFFPTKSVEDLFVLQSNACVLDDSDRLQPNPARPPGLPLRPRVIFAPDFLNSAMAMESRFEDPGSISMVKAAYLEVCGPVYFERDVIVEGSVKVDGRSAVNCRIMRGSLLRDCTFP
ncbi:MAG: UTP--glucose-1-phosphate uridylyltransferase [Desulfomonile sp.]|nr:UTP--glucose-1-phosphate uridylyltransferase [Desulfomonile sp.]